jgi:uncharacterized membrane protein YtjA (UPF0391 family)
LRALLSIEGSTCHSTGFHLLCDVPATGMFLSKTVRVMNRAINYALVILLIAIVAGALGFVVLAGTLAWLGKICFLAFLVLFIISLVQRKRL